MKLDFTMILYELLQIGYSEEEASHLTLKKWMALSKIFREYYNMSIKKEIFVSQKEKQSALDL